MTRNLLILALITSAAGGVARAEPLSQTVKVEGLTHAEAKAKLTEVADQLCKAAQDPLSLYDEGDQTVRCRDETMTDALRQLRQFELSTARQRQTLASR